MMQTSKRLRATTHRDKALIIGSNKGDKLSQFSLAARIDGRNAGVREFHRLADDFIAQLGGEAKLTLVEIQLVKAAAMQAVNLSLAQRQFLSDPTATTADQRSQYASDVGALDRTLRSLGLVKDRKVSVNKKELAHERARAAMEELRALAVKSTTTPAHKTEVAEL